MFAEIISEVRRTFPLVHCITNYVTVNDCANVLLACGASPVMADDENEAEEMVSIASALVINIGTLNSDTIPSMFKAGKKANELGLPVVLDPVGAGASSLRTTTAAKLLKKIQFSVISGNISEIMALAGGPGRTRGVDAAPTGLSEGVPDRESLSLIQELKERTGSVVMATGAADIVTGRGGTVAVKNGHPMMSRVSGTGCMLSVLIGAFCAAATDSETAAVSAAAMFGVAGEIAFERLKAAGGGTSSYRSFLLDEVSLMTSKKLKERIKVEAV